MAKLYIAITADWEGEHFKDLKDFRKIRSQLGTSVPVTHFICPAYFSENIANAAGLIHSAVEGTDEIGLHIHCYHSLINAAGVSFRTAPDYHYRQAPWWRELAQMANLLPQQLPTGRGVPLSAYSHTEIWQILSASAGLLKKHLGIPSLQVFRAGGWIINDDVLQVLQQQGFGIDASAVPPEILSQDYSEMHPGNNRDDHGEQNGRFTDYIKRLWGYDFQQESFLKNWNLKAGWPDKAVKRISQPWYMGSVLELPANGGLSDFASKERTMRPLYDYGMLQVRAGQDFFMSIGMHQEGPLEYKVPLLEFMQSLNPDEKRYTEFITMSSAAEIFG